MNDSTGTTNTGVISIVENPFIYSSITRERLLEIATQPIKDKPMREWSVYSALCASMTRNILDNIKSEERILRTEDHRLYVYRFFDPLEARRTDHTVSYALMGVEDAGKDPVFIALIMVNLMIVDRAGTGAIFPMDFHIYLPRKMSMHKRDIDQWFRLGAALKWVVFDGK